ncbi:hypothetical protein [Streptomyces sp. DH8]|uniref:hypothetical protein n=1 Tax=Streptomyces sp. DH8 TaxID=2857008 RepID=UPI001E54755E|nr:hypothetical protein [Streptomyces sp. DH8]
MKIVPAWLNGRDDRQLAKDLYEGRESASARASRRRAESHRARVLRDGDDAGIEPRRRRFGRT